MVTFTDLAFRVRAVGDLSATELDQLLDFLHERVTRQEEAELSQLALLAKRLREYVAFIIACCCCCCCC